jgi:hypothetical protein
MMKKNFDSNPRIDDPDDFYARLIALHDGLSNEQSQKLNSKLILLMANQIGDQQQLNEILTAAGRKPS